MKTLIKALLGASLLVPAAAVAQDEDRRGRRMEMRGDRQDRPDRAARVEARAQVQAQAQAQAPAPTQAARQFREQRNRADRGYPRQPAGAQAQTQGQPLVAGQQQRFDGDRRGQIRSSLGRSFGDQQGAARGGERREFNRERRDDRQDFARERRDDRQDRRAGTVTPDQFRADRRDERQDYRADRRDDRQDYRAGRNDRQQLGGDRQRNRWDRNAGNGRSNYYGSGNSGFGDGRGFDGRQAWNRGWRNDNRYDWNRYRSGNSSLYRLPRYYAPNGWGNGYRRFSVGITLSSILWDQNYWIDDPWSYRLPEAYGPYRWVRYYDDALLVDIRSGQVVDTVYDIFY